MSDHPAEPPAAASPDLAALQSKFPGWWILPAAFGGYRAEWKSASGVQVHYVYGVTVADLHHRLDVIETAKAEVIDA